MRKTKHEILCTHLLRTWLQDFTERERERERFFGVLVWSCSLARVLEKESRSEGKTEVKIF